MSTWISVTNESALPPFNTPVLVTDGKQMSVATRQEVRWEPTGWDWEITCVDGYEWEWEFQSYSKITHWMPLPALPGSLARRPTVGDRVILLKGGAEETCATPPLVEGQIYTIEEDDKGSWASYRLQGPYSWVCETDVALVSYCSPRC
jgi:hypothetical protein